MGEEGGNKVIKAIKRFFLERIKVKDFYLGLFFLAFALTLLFWLTPNFVGDSLTQSHLKVKPGTFPDLVGWVMLALSLLLIYQSPRTSILVTRGEDKRLSWTVILFICAIFIFFLVSLLIGMLPASMVAVFIMMRIYGYKKMWISVAIAVILPLVIFLFFEKVAQVQLPRGLWLEDLY